jgi:hypothetical protein
MRISRQSPPLWSAAIIGSGFLTLVMMAFDVRSLARFVVVVWFLAVCPGMAWVQLLDVRDTALRWTLAIAASLALDLLLGLAMLYFHLWAPAWGLFILVLIAGAGAGIGWLMPGSAGQVRSLDR